MMKSRELLYLEAELATRCGRAVTFHPVDASALRIVLEPIDDRGRIELHAVSHGDVWTVSDRGASAMALGPELDFALDKMGDLDTPVRREGNAIVADVENRVFVDSIAQFVDHIEFVPVLAGLWSAEFAAA